MCADGNWQVCSLICIGRFIATRGREVVSRKAHNLEIVGSNPTPATKLRHNSTCGFAWRATDKSKRSLSSEAYWRSWTEIVNYHMYYVYILKLDNGQYYAGSTANLKQRIQKHRTSPTATTKRYRPKNLEFYASFKNKVNALAFEKYLKSSSGQAFRNKHLI